MAELGGFTNSVEFQSRYGDTTSEELVTLLFNSILKRDPNPPGLDYWSGQLDDGDLSTEAFVHILMQSYEFVRATEIDSFLRTVGDVNATCTDDVFRLYQATLDREPEYEGLTGWMEILGDGRQYLDVVEGFTNSIEFRTTYGSLDDNEFVTLLYNNVLDRDPKAAGLTGWVDFLETGTLDRNGVVQGFAQSAEFIAKTEADLIDFMRAQEIDDTLIGGAGENTLVGGAGRDTFCF